MKVKRRINVLDIEEEKVNQMAFVFATLAAIGAWAMVRGFLDGPAKDNFILIMPVFGILTQILVKKSKMVKKICEISIYDTAILVKYCIDCRWRRKICSNITALFYVVKFNHCIL